MTWLTQQGTFELSDLILQSGARIPSARLSWKAHGTLAAARDNVIIYPTSFGAQHPDLEWLIGPDKILDPTRWFIVIPDMFGNGLSTSPSDMPDYPTLVTIHDNVQAQRRALADLFGIDRVACVYGWSMGALQAYHWAALFPDAVERIVVNCGVARTAVHNQVFLRSLMATLEAAPQHIGNGRFSAEPRAAKRAFGRIYAALGIEPGFLSSRPAPGGGTGPEPRRARSGDLPQDRLGGSLRRPPRRQPLCAASHLGRADISANDLYNGDLERRPASDQGARPADAWRHRSVFPHRRQRGRTAVPGHRCIAADPEHLGPSRRQPDCQSGRYAVHQERSEGLARRGRVYSLGPGCLRRSDNFSWTRWLSKRG